GSRPGSSGGRMTEWLGGAVVVGEVVGVGAVVAGGGPKRPLEPPMSPGGVLEGDGLGVGLWPLGPPDGVGADGPAGLVPEEAPPLPLPWPGAVEPADPGTDGVPSPPLPVSFGLG